MPQSRIQVEIDLSDEGAADIADLLRLVADAVEAEPHWDTTSAPIHGPNGVVGHWRILEGGQS